MNVTNEFQERNYDRLRERKKERESKPRANKFGTLTGIKKRKLFHMDAFPWCRRLKFQSM